MKKEYIIRTEKLVRIETPKNYNDLVGKYYLNKLKNGRNCFYRITSTNTFFDYSHVLIIRLFTTLEAIISNRDFTKNTLPVFYVLKTEEREILFNVWD